MNIEVVFLGQSSQFCISVELEAGATIKDAIVLSNILNVCDELPKDWEILKSRVGIFGELKSLDTVLQDNDRVEIYKNLLIDPKDARRKRAKLAQKTKKPTANGKRDCL